MGVKSVVKTMSNFFLVQKETAANMVQTVNSVAFGMACTVVLVENLDTDFFSAVLHFCTSDNTYKPYTCLLRTNCGSNGTFWQLMVRHTHG